MFLRSYSETLQQLAPESVEFEDQNQVLEATDSHLELNARTSRYIPKNNQINNSSQIG